MPIEVRDSGTDKTVQAVWAYDAGVDKEVQSCVVHDAGVDKEAYTAATDLELVGDTKNVDSVSTSSAGGYSLGDYAFGGIVYGSASGPGGNYLLITSEYNDGDSNSGNVGVAPMTFRIQWDANETGDGSVTDSDFDGAYNTYQILKTNTYSTVDSIFEWLDLYVQGLNGYTDWYIPSYEEIEVLSANESHLDNIAINTYWSSNESGPTNAFRWRMQGSGSYKPKTDDRRVRACRREKL